MDLSDLDAPARLTLVADWVGGTLDRATAALVAAAVEQDPELARDAAWIRWLIRASADHPLVEPPPVLRQRLRQSFRRWARDHAVHGDQVVEFPTVLIFDSRRDQLQLAARGGAPGDQLHLVFRSELADLVVDARATAPGRFRLSGQVLLGHATSSPVFEAVASGPDVRVVSVDGDDFGRFSADVPDSVERLSVCNGEIRIVATLPLRQP